jgi:peroxiredoxin
LFGRDLFTGNSSDGDQGQDLPVLDQVSELSALGGSSTSGSGGGRTGGPLYVGDQAYPFTLSDLDGNLISLSDYLGRPVIVNFWATWCAPCRIEMPVFQAAFDRDREEGLVILALDQDESEETARDYFYEEMGLTFIPLLDDGSVVATTYGSYSVLPSTYFVDPQGRVVEIHRGPVSLSKIENVLAVMDGFNG